MEILSDTVFRGANVTLSGGTLTINDGTSTNKLVLNGGSSGSNAIDFLHFSENGSCKFSINEYGTITTNGSVKIYGSKLELIDSYGGPSVVLESDYRLGATFRNGITVDNTQCNGYVKIGSIDIRNDATCGSLTFTNLKNGHNTYLDLQNSDGGIILTSANYSNYIQKPQESLKHETIYINFDVPADCTIFSLTTKDKFNCDHLFSATMMKYDSDFDFGTGPLMTWKPVDVDVLVACQAIGKILVRKSSSFAMNSSDGYTLNLIYNSDQDNVVCAASPT